MGHSSLPPKMPPGWWWIEGGIAAGVIGLGLLGLAFLVTMCGGCGASAVGAHARAATVSAVALQGASAAVRESASVDAASSCPGSMTDVDHDACLDRIAAHWAPADVAISAARTSLSLWIDAIDIASHAEDGADLWEPLSTALANVVLEYQRLAAALRAFEVNVPPLPSFVLELAQNQGGR